MPWHSRKPPRRHLEARQHQPPRALDPIDGSSAIGGPPNPVITVISLERITNIEWREALLCRLLRIGAGVSARAEGH